MGAESEEVQSARWACRLVAGISQARYLIVAAAALIGVVAGYGLTYIHFSTDYRDFFDPDNRRLRALERMADTFGRDDNILIVIEPGQGDMFTPQRLALLSRLTERASNIPNAARVDSLTNFPYIDNSALVPEARPLVPDPESLTADDAARIRGIALAEPMLVGRLVSTRTHAVGINISLDLPRRRPGEDRRAVQAARKIKAEILAGHPGWRVGVTGVAPINTAFAVAARQDLFTLTPVMGAALAVLMMIALRSAMGMVLALSGVALSAMIAMGAAGWWGLGLTPPTAAAPVIILTVAVADAMHLLVGYFSARRRGLALRPAMASSLSTHAFPVLLTSVTTAIGFLALNFSDSPPFRHLGNMAALGVGCAFLFSIFVLPAAVLLSPERMGRRFRSARASLNGLASMLIRHPRIIAVLMLGATAALIWQIPGLRINETFYKDFGERVPVRADTQFAIDRLSGACDVLWMLDTGEQGGVHDPKFMAAADGFVGWLGEQKDVAHVTAATRLLRRLDAAVVGEKPGEGQLPQRADAIEAYLDLFEQSAPKGQGLRHLVDTKRSALKVTAVLGEVDSRRLREITASAENYLAKNVPTVGAPVSTGACSMFGEVAHRNIRAMYGGTALAFGLIALCLMAALNHVRLGGVSLVSNMLPPAAAFGIWALMADEAGLAASVVTATSLGIIVDATVHLLTHYRMGRRRGMPASEALRYTFAQCGTAILFGGMVLIAGFAVLGLSSFRITQELGLITALALTAAIIVDFLLLPSLLLLTDRRK